MQFSLAKFILSEFISIANKIIHSLANWIVQPPTPQFASITIELDLILEAI